MDNALKDKIVVGAAAVLVREGLLNWSVDRVAAEVGCAKGLIAYHHGTKKSLPAAVAANLGRHRLAGRLAALQGSGAEALDRLWQTLVNEVRAGEWAAWAALTAEPGIDTRADSAVDVAAFGTAISRVLEVPAFRPEEVRLMTAALDGFQVSLHSGVPAPGIREDYHRLWLSLLP